MSSIAPASSSLACRAGCAACCIAPSISSAIPGMPNGKAAGVACVQLDEQYRCKIFHDPARPKVCASLQPAPDMCGTSRQHALLWLSELDRLSSPNTLPQRKEIP